MLEALVDVVELPVKLPVKVVAVTEPPNVEIPATFKEAVFTNEVLAEPVIVTCPDPETLILSPPTIEVTIPGAKLVVEPAPNKV